MHAGVHSPAGTFLLAGCTVEPVSGSKCYFLCLSKVGSDGVVVITSALHADGREFDPRSDLGCFEVVCM